MRVMVFGATGMVGAGVLVPARRGRGKGADRREEGDRGVLETVDIEALG